MVGDNMSLNGIDISNWQAGIDLSKVPCDFVIVKATEGNNFVDKYCDQFYQQAKKLGKKLGFYHFARPEKNGAKDEAMFFYNNTKNYFGEAIPILDWESSGKWNVDWALEWLNEIKRITGIKPMIYMSESVVNQYDWSKVVKGDYGLWVAKYRDYTPDWNYDMSNAGNKPVVKWWNGYAMWQWTSTGRFEGYAGSLDCDVFYGDALAWDKYAGVKEEPHEDAFVPRLTAPSETDKYYISEQYGGLNRCIIRDTKNGSVLPNCVGYAYGRFMEEVNINKCNLSRANAEDWWDYKDGYERGQTPKLGAVMCWRKGLPHYQGDGAGHVAIVERIFDDGSVLVSESNYSGARFVTRLCKHNYDYYGLTFQGFIYNPFVNAETPVIVTKPKEKTIDELAQEVIDGKWGNGWNRKNSLTQAGYDYEAVQKRVDEILAEKNKIEVGDKVEVTKAVTYNGKPFKKYYDTYTVMELKGKRAVIGVDGKVTASVNIKNLRKVG